MAGTEQPRGQWHSPPERLFERPINPIPHIEFEIMKLASFNGFDGERVVNELVEHRELWRGVVMDRGYQVYRDEGEVVNLAKPRDIEKGVWNVDTLFVLTSGRDDAEMARLAQEEWSADEVDYVEEPDMGIYPHPPDFKVLRVCLG